MERWLSKRIQTNPLSREILLIVPSTCNAADYLDASLAAKGVLELQNPGIRGGSSSDVSSVSMFAIVFNQLLREMDDGGDERPRQGERQRRIPLAVSPSSVVSNVDCEESCIGCSLLSAAPLSSFLSSRDSVFHRAARRRSSPLVAPQTRSNPLPRPILASSATDRIAIGRLLPMSIYLFALPSARRKSTETRRRAAPIPPTSPSIPVPTFPIRVTASFPTKPRSPDTTNATNLPSMSLFEIRGIRDNEYDRRAVIEYAR